MRVYGRIVNSDGTKSWQVVETDANGNNDLVYVTAFAQVLLLGLSESPFYSWAGIPAEDAVSGQVYPDYYVSNLQQIYSVYFASLFVSRQIDPDGVTPIYHIAAVTHAGTLIGQTAKIPI